MKYRTRTCYTDGQKALMWERWKAGWTLHQMRPNPSVNLTRTGRRCRGLPGIESVRARPTPQSDPWRHDRGRIVS